MFRCLANLDSTWSTKRGHQGPPVVPAGWCHPHISNKSLAWLQQRFPDRLISHRCDQEWSPYSPDLNAPGLIIICGDTSRTRCMTTINFFACQVGAPSDQILYILYGGPPQVCFFAYYRGLLDQFLRILHGGPLRSISSLTIARGPLDQFLCILYRGPLRSISSLTI